jgi:hypothetical protein
MIPRKRLIIETAACLALFCGALAPLAAQAASDGPVPFIRIIPQVEAGFIGVLHHTFQSGTGTTNFNYITQGGQDILFPYQRYSVDVVLAGRHHVTALYQPLTFSTSTVADRNNTNGGLPVVIGGANFPHGTPMNLTYGFDFWRLSYLYDFSGDPATILGAGLSLQIRNASIIFSSVDGADRYVSQNIGPVPILKVRAAHWFSPAFGLEFEGDGFYASSAIFNGSGRGFTGWIWDASLSVRTHVPGLLGYVAFLTMRSIGGGAEGNNAYDNITATTSGAGSYTSNVLATMAVTLGLSLEP